MTLRVLVVDDDEVDRQVIRRALTTGLADAAPVIVEVASGDAALTALDAPFGLVVLDYEMPGKNGLETVQAIRAAGHATPILVTTGREDEVVAELMAAGATDFLQKSDITPLRVRSRVRHILRLAEAEAQAVIARTELERAVASRDELLAIVSHDLRNPLHAVGLAIDELASPELAPEMRDRYIAAIHRSLGRAGQLIRDLLDVSRLDASGLVLERRPTRVLDLLEGTVRDHALLLREAHMAARVTVDPTLARRMIDVDPQRTHQALGNLVSNAIKYAGGTEAIDLIGRTDGNAIELVVADRGPGIDPQNLPHIFDRFYQAELGRRAGAGLGLAIARGIARAHGGELSAHLREGGGTEFRYRLEAGPPG